MRRAILILVAAALSAPLLADTPPRIYNKAKEQFRLGAYPAALETLGKLEAEAQKPEYEKERVALLPALHFYRGVCLAALGREPEATAQFAVFLTYQPTASLDPALYPAKVIAVFERTRRSLEVKERPGEGSPSSSLAQAYAAFRAAMTPEEDFLGESWADGPVRHLLTSEERQDFRRLTDPVSRSEFVTNFWKTRDTDSESASNEFREEFEKRIAFADSRFAQDETRGSLTDRGMVFILLGPPTYVGRKPLTTGDDTSDPAALKRYRPSDLRTASQPGGTTAQRAARIDAVTGPGSRINEAASNWREVWHYRRENLPKEVPYLQVDFDFVSKQGYGKNVLQRDVQAIDTLEWVKKRLRPRNA